MQAGRAETPDPGSAEPIVTEPAKARSRLAPSPADAGSNESGSREVWSEFISRGRVQLFGSRTGGESTNGDSKIATHAGRALFAPTVHGGTAAVDARDASGKGSVTADRAGDTPAATPAREGDAKTAQAPRLGTAGGSAPWLPGETRGDTRSGPEGSLAAGGARGRIASGEESRRDPDARIEDLRAGRLNLAGDVAARRLEERWASAGTLARLEPAVSGLGLAPDPAHPRASAGRDGGSTGHAQTGSRPGASGDRYGHAAPAEVRSTFESDRVEDHAAASRRDTTTPGGEIAEGDGAHRAGGQVDQGGGTTGHSASPNHSAAAALPAAANLTGLLPDGRADGALPPAVQFVARAVLENSSLHTQSFRLAINHDELGGIEISLRRGRDGIVVHLFADNPETSRLLAGTAAALTHEVRSAGVGLESVTVAGGERGDTGTAAWAGAHAGGGGEQQTASGGARYEAALSGHGADADRGVSTLFRQPRVGGNGHLDLLA